MFFFSPSYSPFFSFFSFRAVASALPLSRREPKNLIYNFSSVPPPVRLPRPARQKALVALLRSAAEKRVSLASLYRAVYRHGGGVGEERRKKAKKQKLRVH